MSMAIGSLGSMNQVSLTKMHQEMFKRLDQNGDGKVDKTEFAAAGKKQDAGKAEELFAKIDTDQDGSISEAESDAFLTLRLWIWASCCCCSKASAIPRNRMAHSFSMVGCVNMVPHFP